MALQTRVLEDDAAVIALSLRDGNAFTEIFDRHFASIHRYLARRVGTDRADDLASATFTVAFARRDSFRDHADSALPWLYGIATNLLHNESRSERRRLDHLARLEDREPALGAAETTSSLASFADSDVVAALASLDPDQRDVVLLHAWAELSYEEIAASLGIPLGTVRSRLSRARRRLRAELAGRDPASQHSARKESR